MNPENNDQLFPVDDDDLLQFQEEDEEDEFEEVEMDFEEMGGMISSTIRISISQFSNCFYP